MKEKIGRLCILLGLLATTLPAQSWSGDQAVALQVHDSKGHTVAKARVVFTFQGIPGETGPDIVATDGNGRAVLAGLAPGPWQVEVSHPDYLSYIAMVDVRRGKKPLVSASFLEAGGRSLSPVKVKFSKGDRQAASPVLEARQSAAPPAPVAPPESTPPPVPSTAPEQTPAASEPVSAPSPEPVTERTAAVTETTAPEPEPEPAVPEPVSEPAVPEAVLEPAAPEPVSQPETPVEAVPRADPPAPEKAAPPPPEPEPAAPEPTEVEIEDAAEPVAAVEVVVEEVAAIPDPAPGVQEPETEQIPEVTEVVIADVAAAEPEAEIPVPRQQPAAEPPPPVTEPRPEPTIESINLPAAPLEAPPQPPVVAAPTRTAIAVPPPPDPGARITSHSDGSCQDCESAEWTLETSVAVPASDQGSAGTCGTEILEGARVAMQGLSTSIQLELDGFIGPIANGTSQEAIRRVEPDLAAPFTGELAAYVGGTSSCQIVGLVLPKAVRFSRVRLAASDHDETGNCAPGQTCSIGDALWIGSTLVERGPSATVIYGLFENRSAERGRRAVLTAYYRPPNANWKPRLPAVE